jgi:hypothetical protein
MKHRIVILGAAFAFSASLVATAAQTQQQTPPTQQQQQQQQPPQTTPPDQQKVRTEDITLTGCVIQGSSPTVFLFENARLNPANRDEKVRSYVLLTGTEDLQLRPHLNHQVMLVGKGEIKVLPTLKPGEKYKEVDLPRFTITRVTEVSPTCTSF